MHWDRKSGGEPPHSKPEQDENQEKRGVTCDRKSPPFANFAKDGAPSRAIGKQPMSEEKSGGDLAEQARRTDKVRRWEKR